MTTQIIFNEALSRYEMELEGYTVFANVRQKDGTLYIDYVEAPPELRGKGAASVLMEGLVAIAKAENLEIFPICGYAASWLRRHS
ncbi:MAG: N-acetyltransferase [Alphaproteobacteria bacterium]|nr:N-acetyltransferase [Alphaproteobacteria bacterium]MCD8526213.1 N-acetyltransferase [Alphaproteobacteria bacterium]MCD8571411.1 N-acetyltransferase [Alphaproteobacteria bacterium]